MLREETAAILSYDNSQAQQYFDTYRRSEHLEPEKALLIAVLEDAIDTYRKYRGVRDRAGKRKFREAEEWIEARDDSWVFAFDNVCELLGLDPAYIRRGLCEDSEKASAKPAAFRRRIRHRRAA